jgi:hypothetical protein
MSFAQGLGENKSVRITLFLWAQTMVLKIVQVVGQRVSYLRLAGSALGATTRLPPLHAVLAHHREHMFRSPQA